MASHPLDVARKGALFIVSGPSGAGKTSVSRPALEQLGGIELSVSVTTRRPRAGECDGKDYRFVSAADFDRMVADGALAEWAEVHGNRYGTTVEAIRTASAQGLDLLLDIDVQGAAQLRRRFPNAVSIFLAPPSRAKLESRLAGRGTDAQDVVRRRVAAAVREMDALVDYDYLIVNDDLERAVEAFVAIVTSERRRTRLLDREQLIAGIRSFEVKPG